MSKKIIFSIIFLSLLGLAPNVFAYTDIPSNFTFTKYLDIGMQDQEVVYLKTILQNEGCLSNVLGTDYYGPKTTEAVKCFQTKYKDEISSFVGYTINITGNIRSGTTKELNALITPGAPSNQVPGALTLPLTFPSGSGRVLKTGECLSMYLVRSDWGVNYSYPLSIEVWKGGQRFASVNQYWYFSGSNQTTGWCASASFPSSTDYQIKVFAAYDTNKVVLSDKFEIISTQTTPSTITLASPNGGEKINIQSGSYQIKWIKKGITSKNLNIEFWSSTTTAPPKLTFSIPANSLPVIADDQSYTWLLSTYNVPPPGIYKMKIVDQNDSSISDFSDSTFEVYNGTIIPGSYEPGPTTTPGYHTYISDSDVVVVDENTGLEWEQKRVGDKGAGGINVGNYSWKGANDYCENKIGVNGSGTYAGYSDWRLPNTQALLSLREKTKNSDSLYIDSIFTSTNSGEYWSSTLMPTDNDYAGALDFSKAPTDAYGHVLGASGDRIDAFHYVRCVRGGNVNGQYANLTPLVVKSPATGQTQSYGTTQRDDGYYKSGAVLNYSTSLRKGANTVLDGDKIIRDGNTNLEWTSLSTNSYLWQDAQDYCEDGIASFGNYSQYAGYSDWRLPNIKELMTIADYGPVANQKFPESGSSWSSTTSPSNTAFAFTAGISGGTIIGQPKLSIRLPVRCVRGGEIYSSNSLTMRIRLPATGQAQRYGMEFGGAGKDDGYYRSGAVLRYNTTSGQGGIVQDENTGLMWEQKNLSTKLATYTWENAQKYCEDQIGNLGTYSGYSDWRLPNVKELFDITRLNWDKESPYIDTIFSNTVAGGYWSSTMSGLVVDFKTNNVTANTGMNYVRCVRGGITGVSAPAFSNGSPSGVLPAGTTQTTISFTTSVPSVCKYANKPGIAYDIINPISTPTTYAVPFNYIFDSVPTTAHSKLVTGLLDNHAYPYYIRCKDISGNMDATDYLVSFSIASGSIVTTPPVLSDTVVSNGTYTGTFPAGTAQTFVFFDTDKLANCKYSTTAGISYTAMPINFDVANIFRTSHSKLITNLLNNTSNVLYIRCKDNSGNVNTIDYVISFPVGTP